MGIEMNKEDILEFLNNIDNSTYTFTTCLTNNYISDKDIYLDNDNCVVEIKKIINYCYELFNNKQYNSCVEILYQLITIDYWFQTIDGKGETISEYEEYWFEDIIERFEISVDYNDICLVLISSIIQSSDCDYNTLVLIFNDLKATEIDDQMFKKYFDDIVNIKNILKDFISVKYKDLRKWKVIRLLLEYIGDVPFYTDICTSLCSTTPVLYVCLINYLKAKKVDYKDTLIKGLDILPDGIYKQMLANYAIELFPEDDSFKKLAYLSCNDINSLLGLFEMKDLCCINDLVSNKSHRLIIDFNLDNLKNDSIGYKEKLFAFYLHFCKDYKDKVFIKVCSEYCKVNDKFFNNLSIFRSVSSISDVSCLAEECFHILTTLIIDYTNKDEETNNMLASYIYLFDICTNTNNEYTKYYLIRFKDDVNLVASLNKLLK